MTVKNGLGSVKVMGNITIC